LNMRFCWWGVGPLPSGMRGALFAALALAALVLALGQPGPANFEDREAGPQPSLAIVVDAQPEPDEPGPPRPGTDCGLEGADRTLSRYRHLKPVSRGVTDSRWRSLHPPGCSKPGLRRPRCPSSRLAGAVMITMDRSMMYRVRSLRSTDAPLQWFDCRG